MRLKTKFQKRQLKKRRGHRRIKALASRPRLIVYRSLKNISAQIVDDQKGITLVTVASLSLPSPAKKKLSKKAQAEEVGKLIAQKAKKLKIKEVVFDRGPYKYHGRVKALAESARKEGLAF